MSGGGGRLNVAAGTDILDDDVAVELDEPKVHDRQMMNRGLLDTIHHCYIR